MEQSYLISFFTMMVLAAFIRTAAMCVKTGSKVPWLLIVGKDRKVTDNNAALPASLDKLTEQLNNTK